MSIVGLDLLLASSVIAIRGGAFSLVVHTPFLLFLRRDLHRYCSFSTAIIYLSFLEIRLASSFLGNRIAVWPRGFSLVILCELIRFGLAELGWGFLLVAVLGPRLVSFDLLWSEKNENFASFPCQLGSPGVPAGCFPCCAPSGYHRFWMSKLHHPCPHSKFLLFFLLGLGSMGSHPRYHLPLLK